MVQLRRGELQSNCKQTMRTDRAAVNKAVLHDAIADELSNDLTEKQAKFVDAYTKMPGANLQTVAKVAGYRGTSLSARPYVEIRKPKIRKAIAAAFKKLGLTPEYWAWRVKEAAEAETLVWLNGQKEKVPDYKTRLAATRLALELRGAFDPIPQAVAAAAAAPPITLNIGFKNSWQKEPSVIEAAVAK